MISQLPIKAFVAGWPISHSRSPALHRYWLEQYGIAGTYEAIAVQPEDFGSFVGNISEQGFVGGNVTIPHKEAAFGLAAKTDEIADLLGAINTLWHEEGKLCGTNTDAYGFTANLDEFAPGWRAGSTAIVLGAGGASRAVVQAILEAGYSNVHIVNRTASRARSLAERFGARCSFHAWRELNEITADANILVNTTSLGMEGQDETPTPELRALPSGAIVTDIVYSPLVTPLLVAAQTLGLKTVDGLGMLLHQGVPGFEKWFGVRPNVTNALRKHVLHDGGPEGQES